MGRSEETATTAAPQYGGRIRNAWQGGGDPRLGYLITSPGQPSGQFTAPVVWNGAASFVAAFVLGAAAGALAGAAYALPTVIGLDTRRPLARFRNPLVIHVFEALLHWPVALAGKDSGIYWGVPGNKVVGGAEGVGVYNDGGVVTFISRGPNGVETVALAAINPATEWNKVRVDMFHASHDADAGFRVYLNDSLALERRYSAGHRLPVPTAGAPAYAAYLGQDDAAVPMYVRNWHYFDAGSEAEALPY